MSPFTRSLIGILPAWRGLCAGRLPFWTFLGRRAVGLGRLQALGAELRCETCRALPGCRRRSAAGHSRPPRGCPNTRLLAR